MTTEEAATPAVSAEPGLLGSGSAVVFPDSVSLPPTSSRAEWLGQRTRGIGGSDVSAILGLNRWSSPLQVWLEKTGRAQEKRRTWAMVRGSALESSLLDWFEDHEGITVHRTIPTQSNRVDPWMLANLDGAGADGSVVEAKTANWFLRDEWADGQVADHAELQTQWYMAVTGLRHGWVVSAVSDDEPTWVRVEANEKLHVTMYEACGRFWRDNVLADKEPTATAIDLPTLRKQTPADDVVHLGDDTCDSLTRDYLLAHRQEQQAKTWKADTQAKLTQIMGDASTLVIDGKIAATRNVIHKKAYTVEYDARDEVRLTVPKTRKDWKKNGE